MLLEDFSYAMRQLRRAPGFAFTVVFCVIDTVVLQPLPYQHPEKIVLLTVLARKLIGMVIYFEAQQEAGGFTLLALLVMIVGLLAAVIPAARAASIEPVQALRSE
jgi:ABC-type lipoprotein release transport system permease subunit